jgi:hypothetical protein
MSVDGVLVKTVSTYRSSFQGRRVIWSMAFPSSGTHTVRIEVVGTAGHPRVDLDAFVVMR